MKRLGLFFLVVTLGAFAPVTAAYELGDWDVHGTFSQGWLRSEDNNFIEDSEDGTFDFREFALNASTFIGERITLGGQLFGRKYGSVGDDKVFIDWVSASYTINDAIGFRGGKLKMPYGFYGETRDVDSLRTQILLPQGVYYESYRGSSNAMWGGQVFGHATSAHWGSLDYSFQLGRSSTDDDSGELDRLASYVGLDAQDVNDEEAGALKLVWHPLVEGLRLGVTFSWSENIVEGSSSGLLGPEGRYRAELKDQFFLVSSIEYTRGKATISYENLLHYSEAHIQFGGATAPFTLESDFGAYYVNVDYRVTDELTFALGYSGSSVKQDLVFASAQSSSKDKQNGVYASVRYDITPNIFAKAEHHINSGTAGLFQSENPDGFEDDWSITLFKLSFLF